jgi:hypothetical protein
VGRGHPEHVGVEQKKENQADGHEVHVNAEEDAAVVEVPAALHAADGIKRAENGDQCGQDNQRRGMVVREVREQKRCCDAEKNESAAAKEGTVSRVEDVVFQGEIYPAAYFNIKHRRDVA